MKNIQRCIRSVETAEQDILLKNELKPLAELPLKREKKETASACALSSLLLLSSLSPPSLSLPLSLRQRRRRRKKKKHGGDQASEQLKEKTGRF
jgi:hypothetical protein